MRGRAAGELGAAGLKGLKHKLTYKLTHSGLQCRGSSSKCARDILGEIKLTTSWPGLDGKGLGQLDPGTEVLAGAIVFLLSAPPNPAILAKWMPNLRLLTLLTLFAPPC